MAFININVRATPEHEKNVLKVLCNIDKSLDGIKKALTSLVDDKNEIAKQEIFDKLEKAIDQVKSIV